MEQEKIQHLEFIQNIINRMNTNSFQIKGWMITIVSALLALYASSNNTIFIFIAVVPTLVFWFLDSFFLQQERKFRRLYEDLIKPEKNIPAFSMDISNYDGWRYNYFKCLLFSPTTTTLYLIISCSLILGGIIIEKVL